MSTSLLLPQLVYEQYRVPIKSMNRVLWRAV